MWSISIDWRESETTGEDRERAEKERKTKQTAEKNRKAKHTRCTLTE
jgi:hypothetical protein